MKQKQETASLRVLKGKGAGKKKNKKRRHGAFLRAAGATALAVALTLGALAAAGITPAEAWYAARTTVGGIAAGAGFPCETAAGEARAFVALGRNVLLVDESTAKVVSAYGDVLYEGRHGFADAVCETNGTQALLFDRGGSDYQVMDSYRLLRSDHRANVILAGAIGRKGNVAFAQKSDSAMCELHVLDRRGREVYAYSFATERAAAVALSGNGKRAAVALIATKNAEIYTKLVVLDFSSEKPLFTPLVYRSTAMMRLEFLNDGLLLAVGDKLLSVVDCAKGSKKDTPYVNGELAAASFSPGGNTAVAMTRFGNTADSLIKVFSRQGQPLFEKKLDREVSAVACGKHNVCVPTEGGLLIFNDKGEQLLSAAETGSGMRIAYAGNACFVLSPGEINKYAPRR